MKKATAVEIKTRKTKDSFSLNERCENQNDLHCGVGLLRLINSGYEKL